VTAGIHTSREGSSASRASVTLPSRVPMVGRWESESPPVRSQLRANGSQGQGELTAVTVERLAWRIVDLLSDRIVDVVADAVTQAPVLLWSRGRPVCATRDRAGWGKAS